AHERGGCICAFISMAFITLTLAIFIVILLYLLVNRYSTGGNSTPLRQKIQSKEKISENKSDEEVEVIYRCLEKVSDNHKKDESTDGEERKSKNKSYFVERNEAENTLAGIDPPINTSSIASIRVNGPLEKSNETSTSKINNGNVEEAINMQPTTTKQNAIMSVSGDTAKPIPDFTFNRLNVTLPASESFDRLLQTALPLSETSTTSSITRTDNFNVSCKGSLSNGSGEELHIDPSRNDHPSTAINNTPQFYSGNKDIDAIISDAQKKAEKALEETQKLQYGNICDGEPTKAEIQRTNLCQVQIAYSEDMQIGNDMGVAADTGGQYERRNRDDPH
uniref:Uncharacterized protein n=2 Tax=Parascaris univalens TaxID=6257 RepID=A0A915BCZ9_PARUN